MRVCVCVSQWHVLKPVLLSEHNVCNGNNTGMKIKFIFYLLSQWMDVLDV